MNSLPLKWPGGARAGRRSAPFGPTTLALACSVAVAAAGCSRERKRGSPTSEAEARPSPSPEVTAPTTESSVPPRPPQAGFADPAAQHAERSIRLVTGPQVLEIAAESGARALIVNAWASWCGPCRREFPMLVKLADNMKDRGVDVLFVSVDEPEGYDAAVAFAREHGQDGQILVARRPLGPFKRALHEGWPGMLPATFLFDEAGRLRFFWGGPVYEEELVPVVEGLLRGEDIDGEQRFGLRPGRDDRR